MVITVITHCEQPLRLDCINKVWMSRLYCEVTGHSSNAVREYKRTSYKQQSQVSSILQSSSNYRVTKESVCSSNSVLGGNMSLENGSINIISTPNKTMKLSIDGNSNKINIVFE